MPRLSAAWPRLALLAISTLQTACALLPVGDDGPAAMRDQVEAAERAFARSMADRDFAAFRSHLAADTLFFAGEKPLRGADAVAEAWAPFFTAPQAPFSWEPDRVEILDGGRLGYSTGPVRAADGRVFARYNSIWRRDGDGRWRVIFDKGCNRCEAQGEP